MHGWRFATPPRHENGRVLQSAALALAALSLLVTVAVIIAGRRTPAASPAPEPRRSGEPGPPPPSTVEPGPAAVAEPRPTAAATAAAGSSTYVVRWGAGTSAEPTPWLPEPTPTRWPTPAPQPCLEYSWQVSDSPAVIGQVLVEVQVRNRCGRKLEALDVIFRADGIRGGDVIYTAQGNLLESIYPDSVRTVMIALPGSRTFFDTVAVAPIGPPTR